MEIISSHKDCGLVGLGIFTAYSLLEYWLGKTNKIRPASAIELLIAIVVMTFTFFLTRKSKGDSNVDPEKRS